MIQFTPEGLRIDALPEVLDAYSQRLRDIYGDDIDLSQDTPDGQRVGIEAKMRHDLQELALYVANSYDPDLAEGRWLESISKLASLTPRPGTRSQWDLQVTTDRDLTLPARYTITNSGQKWRLDAPVDVTAGQSLVTFQAEDFGRVSGSQGADLEQATVVLGVQDVIATADAVEGQPAETDAEFRKRRNRSTQKPAYSVIGGLNAKLNNLPNVTEARAYENDQDTPQDGMPPHSVWAIVEGGNVADIVETLTKDRTAGSQTIGDVQGDYVETVPRVDDTSIFITHVMRFDRPDYVAVKVRLTATRTGDNPVDKALIADRIAARDQHIGDPLQAASLYQPAYTAIDDAVLTGMEISEDGGSTWTDGRIEPGMDQMYQIAAGDVDVTEVT